MELGSRVRIAVGICVHNEEEYIEYCLKSVYDFAEVIAVSVNTGCPWGGEMEPLDRTLELARAFPDPANKIRIQTGEWADEVSQRNDNMDMVRDAANYYMIVDADEFYTREDLERIRKFIAWRPYIGQFRVRVYTYWKTNPVFRIDPPEPLKQYFVSRLRPSTKFTGLRGTNEKWRKVIPRSVASLHHFSYARTDAKVLQKLRNFSHRDDLVPNWFEKIWRAWDTNHDIENLHPMHPAEYKRAVPVDLNDLPDVMRNHPFCMERSKAGSAQAEDVQ